MNQLDEWPATWTARVGEAVRQGRKIRGLSAAELSARCDELGYRIPRNTITNLENGRKSSIPLHELFVLSRALDIPMVLLACYPDDDGNVEPIPGMTESSGAALLAMTGEERSHRLGGAFDVLDDHRYFVSAVMAWKRLTQELSEVQSQAIRTKGETRDFFERRIGVIQSQQAHLISELIPFWRAGGTLDKFEDVPDDLAEALGSAMKEISRLRHPMRSREWVSDDA